jgi:hypothetical protein
MLLPLQILINLRASGGAVNYILSGTAGSYTYAGQSATFKVGRLLSGANGSYTYTGQTATFKVGRLLSGTAGAYAYSGQAATFKVGRLLPGTAGIYVYTGKAGTFTYTSGSAAIAYTLSGNAGLYLYTGHNALFDYSGVVQIIDTHDGGLSIATMHRKRKKRLREDISAAVEATVSPKLRILIHPQNIETFISQIEIENDDDEESLMLLF